MGTTTGTSGTSGRAASRSAIHSEWRATKALASASDPRRGMVTTAPSPRRSSLKVYRRARALRLTTTSTTRPPATTGKLAGAERFFSGDCRNGRRIGIRRNLKVTATTKKPPHPIEARGPMCLSVVEDPDQAPYQVAGLRLDLKRSNSSWSLARRRLARNSSNSSRILSKAARSSSRRFSSASR